MIKLWTGHLLKVTFSLALTVTPLFQLFFNIKIPREALMNCPKCKSDGTRKFQIVYEEGCFASKNTHSHSVTDGSTHPTNTTTTTHGMTKLAERCAPPQRKYPFILFLIINIVGGAICIVFFAVNQQYDWVAPDTKLIPILWGVYFIFFVSALKLFISGAKYNKNEYPQKQKNWLNSWICLKCGHEYCFEIGKMEHDLDNRV